MIRIAISLSLCTALFVGCGGSDGGNNDASSSSLLSNSSSSTELSSSSVSSASDILLSSEAASASSDDGDELAGDSLAAQNALAVLDLLRIPISFATIERGVEGTLYDQEGDCWTQQSISAMHRVVTLNCPAEYGISADGMGHSVTITWFQGTQEIEKGPWYEWTEITVSNYTVETEEGYAATMDLTISTTFDTELGYELERVVNGSVTNYKYPDSAGGIDTVSATFDNFVMSWDHSGMGTFSMNGTVTFSSVNFSCANGTYEIETLEGLDEATSVINGEEFYNEGILRINDVSYDFNEWAQQFEIPGDIVDQMETPSCSLQRLPW